MNTNEAPRNVSWSDFEASADALAAAGRALLRRDAGAALLATVRGSDAPPRIHPVTVGIMDGSLCVFLLNSAKRRDLAEDGRYALHAALDPDVPREFSVRGIASLVPPGERRDAVAAGWFFEVDDSYDLYELLISTAILGERESSDDWPPRYTRWSA